MWLNELFRKAVVRVKVLCIGFLILFIVFSYMSLYSAGFPQTGSTKVYFFVRQSSTFSLLHFEISCETFLLCSMSGLKIRYFI